MKPWNDESGYPPPQKSYLGNLLGVIRCLVLGLLVFGGLGLLLLVRVIERVVQGDARPWTSRITCLVCRNALRVLQLRFVVHGVPTTKPGAIVANHASWLDIFALNSCHPVNFAAKAEVRNWLGIGWLARATGTLFIERNRKRAQEQTKLFADRLLASDRLLFFPEGTSTDGRRVLPFKPTLFQSFLIPELRGEIVVQPVAVTYHAPSGQDSRFYGWWGDMSFGAHLWGVLSAPRQGRVEVHYLDPIKVGNFADRKALALTCEIAVRDRFERQLSL